VLTEELLRIFPLAITHAKVVNSRSGKMVIARYRICPVATGGFGGLSPPKQTSKPPQIEI